MNKIKLALLIEDEEIDQRQYSRVLTRSGMVDEVKSFVYADEALKFLVANPELDIDVIFLDINMPRMDGFEFLEKATDTLGESFARVVVAMLTTSLNPRDVERAKRFSVVREYINKPLTIEHVKKVAELLGH